MHDSVKLGPCTILSVPAPVRNAAGKSITDMRLALAKKDDAVNGVIQLRLPPELGFPPKGAIDNSFLVLCQATVNLNNMAGASAANAVAILLEILRDCTKASPIQTFVMGHDARRVAGGLMSLSGLCGAAGSQLDLSALQVEVCRLLDAEALPVRMGACLSALLSFPAAVQTEEVRAAAVRAVLVFFHLVVDHVVFIASTVRPLMHDRCSACDGSAATATTHFLVAIQRRPTAPPATLLPWEARLDLEDALVIEGRDRGLLPDMLSVQAFGQVTLVRGHWCGQAGFAAASAFAANALRIVQQRCDPPVAVGIPATIAFEVDVLLDELDEPRHGDQSSLMSFGTRPMFRPDCFFAGKPECTPGIEGAVRCRKINRLDKRKCRLGPGLMTYVCPHRILYGYSVMDQFESPRMVFAALRAYFPFPPAVIVYDMSCVLFRYCMARNPSLFKDTLFLLDRFHQVPIAYSLRSLWHVRVFLVSQPVICAFLF